MSKRIRAKFGMEQLEARDQMSVSYSVVGGVLTFSGDVGGVSNDYVEVRDTGGPGLGNVSYRYSPTAAFRTINEDIWKINVNTGDGTDTVRHTMTGNLTNGLYREVNVDLGAGADEFTSTVNGNITGPNNAYGLHVIAVGGTGNDRMTGTMNGDILGAGDLAFSFAGGDGVDFMTVNLGNDVDIATGARFWSNLYGGAGNDNAQFTYDGEMDGHLLFALYGEGDSDWVRANVTIDANSTGHLGGNGYSPARVDGGAGDFDTVEFEVRNMASMIPVTAEIWGGAGKDTIKSSQLWVTRMDYQPGVDFTPVNLPN
jgi:hypothetical protein